MDSDLATALAAERAIVRSAVACARPIDGGWVVRHPPLPGVWHLNRVHLTGPASAGLDGAGLERLAERELAGVGHRRVTVDDTSAADAVWPWLESRGWRRERSVVMVRAGRAAGVAPGAGAAGAGSAAGFSAAAAVSAASAAAAAAAASAASVLDGESLAAFQLRAFADEAGGGAVAGSPAAELPARLAETQAALRAGTAWRAFGAGSADDGLPASSATLYLDPDVDGRRVAFVDQVATLRAFRERGLARAVTEAALEAAAAWEADLVALFADADDWPQIFYASLGFVTVGRQTVFHRDV